MPVTDSTLSVSQQLQQAAARPAPKLAMNIYGRIAEAGNRVRLISFY